MYITIQVCHKLDTCSSWLYRQHKYSSSAIVRAVRVSKSNARSTSQEDNSGIHINCIGMMMAAMGMQYSTHEIQQQLVLLQGHELCLDDSERAFFHCKDPCCELRYELSCDPCSYIPNPCSNFHSCSTSLVL